MEHAVPGAEFATNIINNKATVTTFPEPLKEPNQNSTALGSMQEAKGIVKPNGVVSGYMVRIVWGKGTSL